MLRTCGGRFATTQHHAPVDWAFFRQKPEGSSDALAGEEPLRAPAESCLQDVRVMQRIIEIAEIG